MSSPGVRRDDSSSRVDRRGTVTSLPPVPDFRFFRSTRVVAVSARFLCLVHVRSDCPVPVGDPRSGSSTAVRPSVRSVRPVSVVTLWPTRRLSDRRPSSVGDRVPKGRHADSCVCRGVSTLDRWRATPARRLPQPPAPPAPSREPPLESRTVRGIRTKSRHCTRLSSGPETCPDLPGVLFLSGFKVLGRTVQSPSSFATGSGRFISTREEGTQTLTQGVFVSDFVP